MASLFVLLPSAPVTAGSEFAHVVSVDGRHADVVSSTPAALLPAASGAGAEVVAVVPATALSWHRLDWPRGVKAGSPRLRAAIEGLLEEQLLDEPQALHFAVGAEANPGESTWVAVCDRAWLRAGLAALESAGRAATRIVPEVAPEAPAAVHAVGDPEAALLLVHGPQGVLTLPLTATSMALMPTLPEDTLYLAEPAVAEHAEALLQRPLVLQTPAQRWLQAAQSSWDLAQFEFASSGRTRAVKRLATAGAELLRAPMWRPARWAGVLLLGVHLVGLNAWAWKQRAQLTDGREALRASLTQTFPQVQRVVNPTLQMEREVAALRRATGVASADDLETLLGVLAAAAPRRTVSGIDYARGVLRVTTPGWIASDREAVPPALRGQGLRATLQGDALVVQPEGRP